jgi:pimeloyl-ACP methyl ester carboxylesterase
METINSLEGDPRLRERYQFWVFGYPTGNPILYSALRLREELAKVDKLYPNHRPYVLVGHSMGGIISHAQVTTVTRQTWERQMGDIAGGVFERNAKDSLIIRVATFHANPRIRRVVYVCTPHRGSKLAIGGLGKLVISLIQLPFALAHNLTTGLTGEELVKLTGNAKRLPTSVSGLSPTNPALKVLNSATSTAPYHSIIGDRGRGDSPNSSDGVVPYWSSHLDGAKSERIVPGPHSSCELPQTIAELDRIMVLHLKNQSSLAQRHFAHGLAVTNRKR